MTKEQHEWIVDNVKGRLSAELTRMYNERFKPGMSVKQMRAYKKNHKLSSGVNCSFRKGHVPQNKGKKVPKELQSTKSQFKKGRTPHNHLSVGSEIIDTYGYSKVKVADPNVWEFKHKLVYREHHGEIPEGYAVIFADGDRMNMSVENLVAVSKSVRLILNRKGLIKPDADLTKSGIGLAKLMQEIYKAEKQVRK